MASVLGNSRYVCRSCIRRLSQNSQTIRPFAPLSQTRGLRIRGRGTQRFGPEADPSLDVTYQPRAFQSLPGAPLKTKVRIDYDKASRATLVGSLFRLGYQKDPNSLEELGSDLSTDQLRQLCKDLEANLRRVVKSRSQPFESIEPVSPPPASPTAMPVPTPTLSNTHRVHLDDSMAFNMYWETVPPTIWQKNQARDFFTQKTKAQFLRSVARFREFPEGDVPEVAFVGRSNVGKSSLLNAIVNSSKGEILARISSTPGCTRTMNLYGIGDKDGVRIKKGKNNGHDRIVGVGGILVVDLPGYGEGSLSEWGTEIMKYLTKRKQLRRVFVLIDAVHGVKEKDLSLLASLRLAGVPHQVILSKLDRLYIPDAKKLERISKGIVTKSVQPLGTLEATRKKLIAIREQIQPAVGAGALGELLSASAEIRVDDNRLGMDSVRFAILQAAGFKFKEADSKQKRGKSNAASRSIALSQERRPLVSGENTIWA